MPATVFRSTGSSPYTTSAITVGVGAEAEECKEQHQETDAGDRLPEVGEQEDRCTDDWTGLRDEHPDRNPDGRHDGERHAGQEDVR